MSLTKLKPTTIEERKIRRERIEKKKQKEKENNKKKSIYCDEKYYDIAYENSLTYAKHPKDIFFYPLWLKGINDVTNIKPKIIVDLGCGIGHFAQLLYDSNSTIEKYIGYDFSKVALAKAVKRVNEPNYVFKYADLLKYEFNNDLKEYDSSDIMFVSYEFLEHVPPDIEILSKIPKSCWVSFSVPNYICMGHVRIFKNVKAIKTRYNNIIKIKKIKRIVTNKEKNKVIFYCLGIRR